MNEVKGQCCDSTLTPEIICLPCLKASSRAILELRKVTIICCLQLVPHQPSHQEMGHKAPPFSEKLLAGSSAMSRMQPHGAQGCMVHPSPSAVLFWV